MKNCYGVLRIMVISMILFVFHLDAVAKDYTGGASKIRLAIMELTPKGVSKVVADAVTDLIRSDIVDTGRFIVVERSQMEAIFREQGLQMTGCTDNVCAVEIGKLLSASKVLVGEINQLDKTTIITVRIVDVSSGVAEYSTSEKAESLNELDSAVKKLVQKLTMRMTGESPVEYGSNPYTWKVAASGLAAAAFFGGGFYYDRQVAGLNDDISDLSKEYGSPSTTDSEAEIILKNINDDQDKADKYTLYRNILYGAGALSTLVMSYYMYEYFTFDPLDEQNSSFYAPVVVPVCWYLPAGNSDYSDKYYMGMGLTVVF